MEEKSIELEGTRARVRQLELRPGESRKTSSSSLASTSSASKLVQTELPTELAARLGTDNYVKFGALDAARGVTFDLGPKKAKLLEAAALKKPAAVDVKSRQPSQLPSNAKQQLQEMAGIKRNYRKNSDTPQHRPTPQHNCGLCMVRRRQLRLLGKVYSERTPKPIRHTCGLAWCSGGCFAFLARSCAILSASRIAGRRPTCTAYSARKKHSVMKWKSAGTCGNWAR